MSKLKVKALKEYNREKHKNSTVLVEFVDSVVRTIDIYKYHKNEVYPYLSDEPNVHFIRVIQRTDN